MIEDVIAKGYFIILLPNHQSWGTEAITKKMKSRLSPEAQNYVLVAPAPQEDQRLHKYLLKQSDMVVTVIGGLMHIAYTMGKPLKILDVNDAVEFAKWFDWGADASQTVTLQGVSLGEDIRRTLDEGNKNNDFSPRKSDNSSTSIETLFNNPKNLFNFFAPLLDESDLEAQAYIRQAFPEINGYFYPFEEHLNYDLQQVEQRDLTFIKHIFERGLQHKILGLEDGDYSQFQEEEFLSKEAFDDIARKYAQLKQEGLLSYFLISFLYHDVAKAGLKEERLKWEAIEGIDLRIPNKASALILRNMGGKGLFENMVFLKDDPDFETLNEFFYRVIAIRGSAGQWIRGELGYDVFEKFTDWIRHNFEVFKKAIAPDQDDSTAAQRISDIIYLFDFIDTASVREGLMTDELNQQFIQFYQDFTKVITPKNKIFEINWTDIFNKRWLGLENLLEKRRYLIDRLSRFRVERREAGELPEKLFNDINSLRNDQLDRLIALLDKFQGWYVESATSAFTPKTQIKLIALSVALAEHQGVDITKPFHINFFHLMKMLSEGRQNYRPYETRIVEAFMHHFSLDEILFNQEIISIFSTKDMVEEVSPLIALNMTIDGEKAISFELNLTEEAKGLLSRLEDYAHQDTTRSNKDLIDLLDYYGIRKDEYDWVHNELDYLNNMAAARNDKARLSKYVKGRVLDVGAAGGAMLGILEEFKENLGVTEIIGLDISETALLELEKTRKEEGWTSVRLVKGDAYQLGRVLKEANITAPNTYIFNSVFHEIFSYERDGKKFNIDSVRDLLKAAFQTMNEGDRLEIRDGVIPEDGEDLQIMRIFGQENKEFFDDYMHHFEGRAMPYKIISADQKQQIWKIRIKRKDAMEFLFTLTWGQASFPREVQEQYGIFTRRDYISFLQETAQESGIRIREVPIPLEEQSYLQQGYIDNIEPKVQLFDLEGNKLSLPDSNMIIVVERVSNEQHAFKDKKRYIIPVSNRLGNRDLSKPIKVLLDVHGIVIESTWRKEFARAYQKVTGDSIVTAWEWVKKYESEDLFERLVQDTGRFLEEVKAIYEAEKEYLRQTYKPKSVPRSYAFVKALLEQGVSVIMMSGSSRELILEQLRHRGFLNLVPESRVMGQDDMIKFIGHKGAYHAGVRDAAIQMIQAKNSDYTLIQMNDGNGGIKAVQESGGIAIGFVHQWDEEGRSSAEMLKQNGIDAIIPDGWQYWEDVVSGLNINPTLQREVAEKLQRKISVSSPIIDILNYEKILILIPFEVHEVMIGGWYQGFLRGDSRDFEYVFALWFNGKYFTLWDKMTLKGAVILILLKVEIVEEAVERQWIEESGAKKRASRGSVFAVSSSIVTNVYELVPFYLGKGIKEIERGKVKVAFVFSPLQIYDEQGKEVVLNDMFANIRKTNVSVFMMKKDGMYPVIGGKVQNNIMNIVDLPEKILVLVMGVEHVKYQSYDISAGGKSQLKKYARKIMGVVSTDKTPSSIALNVLPEKKSLKVASKIQGSVFAVSSNVVMKAFELIPFYLKKAARKIMSGKEKIVFITSPEKIENLEEENVPFGVVFQEAVSSSIATFVIFEDGLHKVIKGKIQKNIASVTEVGSSAIVIVTGHERVKYHAYGSVLTGKIQLRKYLRGTKQGRAMQFFEKERFLLAL